MVVDCSGAMEMQKAVEAAVHIFGLAIPRDMQPLIDKQYIGRKLTHLYRIPSMH